MSGQFKVGEVAIIQNAEFRPERNGQECCILAAGLRGRSRRGEIVPAYRVKLSNGEEVLAAPYQLRKRRPPSADESKSRQAMLDCIERAKQPLGVEA